MNDESLNDNLNKPAVDRRKYGLFFIVVLAFLILIIAGFGFGYFELMKVNTQLAQMVDHLNSELSKDHDDLISMQKNVNDIKDSDLKTQAINQKQQQLLDEWQAAQNGDLNKWHLAEAQYFVKLANDHLQFSQNIPLAIQLLQRAQSEVQPLQGQGIADIQDSLAHDLQSLESLPQIDISSYYTQLNVLSTQIDQLPLPVTPLKAEEVQQSDDAENLPWWKAGWKRTKMALAKIVIVRRVGENDTPVVLPEEKMFLYQNLHAQLENAMWALIHRNNTVYQSSLERMQKWIAQYFVQDAEITKSIQQQLDVLAKLNVQPQHADISATVKLFDNAMTSNMTPAASSPSDNTTTAVPAQ